MPEQRPHQIDKDDVLELADALRVPLIRISHILRRETAELPLTMPQSAILGHLIEGEKKTVTALANAEGVKPPTMADLLFRMEAQGWIEKTADPTDRRVSLVSMTQKGRELLGVAVKRRNESLSERLARLSEIDRERLAEAVPALRRLAMVSSEVLEALEALATITPKAATVDD